MTKLIRKAHQTLEAARAAADSGWDEDDTLTFACSQFTLNDFGHVARLAVRHGDRIRFVPELGWVAYDGKRWDAEKGDQVVRRLAQETLGDIVDEADFIDAKSDEEEGKCPKKERFAYALRACSSAKVKSLLETAQAHFLASVEDFDKDASLLGVHNGVVDLRTGALVPHDPGFMLTRLAAVDFDPDATAPRWERFLDEVMLGDGAVIQFLQELMGYAAFGHQKEEICAFCTGDESRQQDNGSNGKSVFLETIGKVYGEHRVTVSRKLLVEQKAGSGIPNDIAKLRGARIAIGAEFKRTDIVDEERYKQATGGDTLEARFLHREFFDFRSTAFPIFSTNTIPMLTGLDNGTKRRLLVIPFLNRWYRPEDCPPGEKVVDRDLEDTLAGELEGVMAWIVAGAVRYHQNGGLTIPSKLIAARDKKMKEFNPLQDFADICLEEAPRMTMPFADVAACYRNFIELNEGEGAAKKVTSHWLGRRLNDIGFTADDAETRRLGVGIRRGYMLSEVGKKYLEGQVNPMLHASAKRLSVAK